MDTYQFADGRRFDARSGEVVVGTDVRRLEPQPAALLALLASRPGILVTHDEIRQHLWADGRHVEFAGSLHYAVGQVRRALGDTVARSLDIETVPRRGYRLRREALARLEFPADDRELVGDAAARPALVSRRLRWLLAAAAAAALIGVAERRPNNHHEVAVAVVGALHDFVVLNPRRFLGSSSGFPPNRRPARPSPPAGGTDMVKELLVIGGALAATTLGVGAWKFTPFVAPLAWTGEPARLAAALGITRGARVADIGAGTGAMALAMSRLVGDEGHVYATELSAARRAEIAGRAARGAAGNLEVVEAQAAATGLPDACCEAVYLRHVLHHVADRPAFAAALARTVRPGGRIGVIDFPPGALWFHGADHGVTAEAVGDAFSRAGWRLRERHDDWGGGMFLVVFEAPAAPR